MQQHSTNDSEGAWSQPSHHSEMLRKLRVYDWRDVCLLEFSCLASWKHTAFFSLITTWYPRYEDPAHHFQHLNTANLVDLMRVGQASLFALDISSSAISIAISLIMYFYRARIPVPPPLASCTPHPRHIEFRVQLRIKNDVFLKNMSMEFWKNNSRLGLVLPDQTTALCIKGGCVVYVHQGNMGKDPPRTLHGTFTFKLVWNYNPKERFQALERRNRRQTKPSLTQLWLEDEELHTRTRVNGEILLKYDWEIQSKTPRPRWTGTKWTHTDSRGGPVLKVRNENKGCQTSQWDIIE